MKVLFASDGSDCADRAARFLITSLDKAIKNLRVTLFYVDAPVLDRVAAALGERRIAEIHQENSDACLKGARRRLKRSGLRFDECTRPATPRRASPSMRRRAGTTSC